MPLVVVVDLTMQRAFPVAFAFDRQSESQQLDNSPAAFDSYDIATN